MSWFDYANLPPIVALTKSYKLKQFFAVFFLSKFFNSMAESAGNGISKPQVFTFFQTPLFVALLTKSICTTAVTVPSCFPVVFALG
jgi:hypothetical protein